MLLFFMASWIENKNARIVYAVAGSKLSTLKNGILAKIQYPVFMAFPVIVKFEIKIPKNATR